MVIRREEVLEKLSQHLREEIAPDDVYAWTLAVIVDPEYEKISIQDSLINVTVKALLDANNKNADIVPTRKLLEYYRQCLAGEAEYHPDHINECLEAVDEKGFLTQEQIARIKKEKVEKTKRIVVGFVFGIAALYVFVFGLSLLAFRLYSIIRPEFVAQEGFILTRMEVTRHVLPHILYALLILLPRGFIARGWLFYFAFLGMIAGMGYHLVTAVRPVLENALPLVYVLVALPFRALPAMLAVVLLLIKRQKIKRNARDAGHLGSLEVVRN